MVVCLRSASGLNQPPRPRLTSFQLAFLRGAETEMPSAVPRIQETLESPILLTAFSPNSADSVQCPIPQSDRNSLRAILTPGCRRNHIFSNLTYTWSGVVSEVRSASLCWDVRAALKIEGFVKARAWRLKWSPIALRHETVSRYLCIRPTNSMKDTSFFYPVVRPAGELPVSDRGVHRHRVTIQRDRPVSGAKPEYHLLSATAAAFVRGCPISQAHIQNTLLDIFRNRLGELKP